MGATPASGDWMSGLRANDMTGLDSEFKLNQSLMPIGVTGMTRQQWP